jgi:hypothetical protein
VWLVGLRMVAWRMARPSPTPRVVFVIGFVICSTFCALSHMHPSLCQALDTALAAPAAGSTIPTCDWARGI